MRQSRFGLEEELENLKKQFKVIQDQYSKSSFVIQTLRDKIKELEEDNQNLERELENFNLLQILSQSGILRSIRIGEGQLETLLSSLIQTQFKHDLESMDAPRPARAPRKKTTRS